MWSLFNFHGDNADRDEKLTALYGEEWKDKSPENLMDNRYFKEITEFLHSRKKILTCESVSNRIYYEFSSIEVYAIYIPPSQSRSLTVCKTGGFSSTVVQQI